MHRLTFIRRGMTRRPVRSALLITSIAIAFFIYLVLTSFERGFLGGEVESERLVVSNKIGGALPLPISYYDKILALPGIASATYMARSRATYRTPSNFLGLTAVEPDSFPAFIGDEYDISAETLARFRQTRNGVIVGRSIATQEGWVVGQKITLNTSSFFRADGSSDFEFEIAGILDGRKSADTHFVMARYDYINSERGVDRDTVSNFGVLPRSGAHADDVIKAVDTLFANSAYQTRTRTEAEFMRDFIAQFADIATIVRLVVGVAFVTILMIVANTMVFAIRERTKEIGLLKVLGFSRRFILGNVLAETFSLFAAGLALAVCLAYAAIILLREPLHTVVPDMSLAPATVLQAIGLSAVLAAATAVIPAYGAMRAPPHAALREK
ncbi:FtsX-like permease family protein [Rhizobium sp. SG741]|uniref:ABC transporter permease n=1 Tax=Rhizobium sp. SG741 TaxID=2587114 RepID=UPI001445607B|nr:FtsX-like permease family protein [Rhizobium sp. SG741]NKJ06548.1 putative ABC transport system permease protein [Rhizobium sp. SG741]